MSPVLNNTISSTCSLQDEQVWIDLINLVRTRTRHFLYSAYAACWRGQAEEIIEDVVQETMRRIFERYQQAERGAALPINSLEHMAVRIAHNYLIDLLRRDRHLRHIYSYPEEFCLPDGRLNFLEIAMEHVIQEELFMRLAYIIALFPEKRRKALLIDLANRMCFVDAELTSLQKAFLAVGIDLRMYQQTLPSDARARAKHSALMSLAYKQLAISMREYSLDNEE